MDYTKNLRNMKVTPESGKDVKDTKCLDGVATPSKAFKETNETVQYNTSQKVSGMAGGENTNS